jgi:signal transduction histidine kinase
MRRTPGRSYLVVAVVVIGTSCAGLLHALLLTRVLDGSVAQTLESTVAGWVGRSVRQAVPPSAFDRLSRPSERDDVARGLLALLERQGGFRIKVYDGTGTVLWSDKEELVGRSFPDNDLLTRALGGAIVSKIEEPTRSEHVFERDQAVVVSEVYVPIHDTQGHDVLGVVEVYQDASGLVEGRRRARTILWSGAAVATGSLTVALTCILWASTSRLLALQGELSREAEKLESVVEGIGAGLCLVDAERRIVWANRVLEGWFGDTDGLVGKTCFQACWGESSPCADCAAVGGATRSRMIGGEPRHFHVRSWPIGSSSTSPAVRLELVQDATEQVEIHAQLLHASKLAAVGELAGSVAHEVNNPVGVILANATHLLRRAEPCDRDGLELIRKNAQRVAAITSGLLQFARRLPGERTAVDLNQVVGEAVALVRHRFDAGAVTLESSLASDLPGLHAVHDEVLQACVNLLNNALDAVAGGGHVTTRTSRERARVILEVSDTGEGIAPQHLARVFDPFFSTKEAGKGTGLGLAITKRILDAHGGEIRVRSAPGEGACFTISLPPSPEDP